MVVVIPEGAPTILAPDGAFADYLDLRTAVIEIVRNSDISDVFPRLVALTESRFNRELRMAEQITSATVTIDEGRAALPSNVAEIIGLYDAMGREYLMQPSQAVSFNGYFFAIEGTSIVAPKLQGDLVLQYYATLPPLADGLTVTNWLLQKYPDVYCYGVGFEAAKYLRDVELSASIKGLLDDALRSARGDDHGKRYSRARVRVAGVNP